MTFKNLLELFSDKGCQKVYIKRLSPNDNSKNQVYLGGSFEVINVLPIKDIIACDPGDWKRNRFKSKLDFYWTDEEGQLFPALEAQLILYPKYPEVRFSGFLKGSKGAPSELMTSRLDNRLLFLGIKPEGQIIGFVSSPDSEITREFESLKNLNEVGVFTEIAIIGNKIELDTKGQLIKELKRIHELGWIDSKRLDANRNILPCISSNCGGYTLEAELGITPNGYAEPDYLGWEIKQFAVKDFRKYSSSVVTLMTPEPTHGLYVEEGVEAFIRKFGYADKMGREARLNFGGIHKYDRVQDTTKLKLTLEGYDPESNKITDSSGCLALVDTNNKVAASWSFISLLKHWNKKHANACYVPSLIRKDAKLFPLSKQQYSYGNNIMLGSSTDFSFFLNQIGNGNIYYDPGIKLELAIEGGRKQNIKRRSQFRIKSGNISSLYSSYDIINLEEPI